MKQNPITQVKFSGCYVQGVNAQGSRLIIVIVHIRAVRIYM
jgi:hypothetical protein